MNIFEKGPILLLVVFSVIPCVAQEKLRWIEQPAKFTYKNTPIEIAVYMDGKKLPNREVRAGSEWLRNISLEVTNTSKKHINWLLINLMLREPVYGARTSGAATAGIVIPFDLRFSNPNIKVLAPGEKTVLKPPASMINYWTDYARGQGIEDIEKVVLDIKQAGFTDDTAWTRGSFSRRDPDSGRMVFIDDPSDPPVPKLPTSMLIPNPLPSFFLI